MHHWTTKDTLEDHDGPVRALSTLPGGELLSGGGPGDVEVRLWKRRPMGPQEWRVALRLSGHASHGAVCAIAPVGQDSRYFCSGGQGHGGEVRVWGAGSGEHIADLRREGGEEMDICMALVAMPTSSAMVASGGTGGHIRLWDCERGRLVHELAGEDLEMPGGGRDAHPSINALALGQGGLIVGAGTGGVVRLWDGRSKERPAAELTPTMGVSLPAIHALSANSAGSAVASGSTDGIIRVWDLRQRKVAAQVKTSKKGAIFALATLPNGYLVAGGACRKLVAWDVKRGEIACETDLQGPIYSLTPYVNSIGHGHGVWVGGEFHSILRLEAIEGGEIQAHKITAAMDTLLPTTLLPSPATLGGLVGEEMYIAGQRGVFDSVPSAALPLPSLPSPSITPSPLKQHHPRQPGIVHHQPGQLPSVAPIQPPLPIAAPVSQISVPVQPSPPHYSPSSGAIHPPPMLNSHAPLPCHPLSSLKATIDGRDLTLPTPPANLPGELVRLQKEVASFSSALTASERKALDAEALSVKYKAERDAIVLNSRMEAEVASKEEARQREAAALKIAEDARARTIALEAALKEAQHEIHAARSMGEQWSRDSMQLSREVRELHAALEAARSASSSVAASRDQPMGAAPLDPPTNSFSSLHKLPSSAPQFFPTHPHPQPHATHMTTSTANDGAAVPAPATSHDSLRLLVDLAGGPERLLQLLGGGGNSSSNEPLVSGVTASHPTSSSRSDRSSRAKPLDRGNYERGDHSGSSTSEEEEDYDSEGGVELRGKSAPVFSPGRRRNKGGGSTSERLKERHHQYQDVSAHPPLYDRYNFYHPSPPLHHEAPPYYQPLPPPHLPVYPPRFSSPELVPPAPYFHPFQTSLPYRSSQQYNPHFAQQNPNPTAYAENTARDRPPPVTYSSLSAGALAATELGWAGNSDGGGRMGARGGGYDPKGLKQSIQSAQRYLGSQ